MQSLTTAACLRYFCTLKIDFKFHAEHNYVLISANCQASETQFLPIDSYIFSLARLRTL